MLLQCKVNAFLKHLLNKKNKRIPSQMVSFYFVTPLGFKPKTFRTGI